MAPQTRASAFSALGEDASELARARAVAIGVLIAGGVALIDSTWGEDRVVIGTVVIAPFVVSMLAGLRETAFIGTLAVFLAAVSVSWNDNFSDAYLLRLALVMAGSAIAVVAAGSRVRVLVDRRRFALLADVADVADGRLSLEQTAQRLSELMVPAHADACVIDALDGDSVRRLAAAASGPHGAERERSLMSAPAWDSPPGGVLVEHGVGRPGAIQIPASGDAVRSLAWERAMRIPLRARGRSVGALTLLTYAQSQTDYVRDDVRFAEVLAGRVALALDNAGLSQVLRTTEAQLTTALGSLSEAVTIQSPTGELVYANDAAVELLGFATPEELLSTPPAAIVARFDSFHADGRPLELADVPGRRVLAGQEPAPLEVRVVDKATGVERWRRTTASGVYDDEGTLQLVVNVIADITLAKRAELSQRLLAQAGEALVAPLDPQQPLQRVADLLVPELADWCAISLPDDHGVLATVAVAHVDPDKVSLAMEIGSRYPVRIDEPDGIAQVYREGIVQHENEISDEMLVAAARDDEHLATLRSLGMRAALVLPMAAGAETLGVLTLVSAESGRSFSDADVALVGEIARRAATAVENARLYAERTQIARTLQTSLLPEELPDLAGWRTAALYRPAGDENWVGGDFYDAFETERGLVFIVGDVTGRGAQAAALTGLMRHSLRTAATLTGSARSALIELNRKLCAGYELSLCTAVCVEVREAAGGAQADIFCAGHPLPLLTRDGAAEYVGEFGTVLGAYPDRDWQPSTLALRDGDVLTLYSDGATDTVGERGRFGLARLRAAATQGGSAAEVVRRIDEALLAFQVGEQADDTAILAIERLPAAPG